MSPFITFTAPSASSWLCLPIWIQLSSPDPSFTFSVGLHSWVFLAASKFIIKHEVFAQCSLLTRRPVNLNQPSMNSLLWSLLMTPIRWSTCHLRLSMLFDAQMHLSVFSPTLGVFLVVLITFSISCSSIHCPLQVHLFAIFLPCCGAVESNVSSGNDRPVYFSFLELIISCLGFQHAFSCLWSAPQTSSPFISPFSSLH